MTSEPAQDRKAGLIAFGLLQLAIGGLCALLVPLMLLGAKLSAAAGQPGAPQAGLKSLVPTLTLYGLGAAWFIWLGIGSMLARRWARALIAASSWLWFASGTGGFLTMLVLLPDLFAQMGSAGQIPSRVASVIKVFLLAFMAVIYIAIPLSLALFYSSGSAKATCERRNPARAWTDACPLPVLAAVLLFGLWAVSLLGLGGYDWALPFFGAILRGPSGAAAALALSALAAYLAWGAYRLDRRAWAASVALVLVLALSVALTFARHSLSDYYAAMGLPAEQARLVTAFGATHARFFAGLSALWFAAFLGYLLYTRRFYPPAPTRTSN
jgi:hypothetical protein